MIMENLIGCMNQERWAHQKIKFAFFRPEVIVGCNQHCPLLQGNVQNRIHPGEAKCFWGGLVAFPALWVIFFLVTLFGFSFKWMVRL